MAPPEWRWYGEEGKTNSVPDAGAIAVPGDLRILPASIASALQVQPDPWDQRGVYIRLSKQRKAALLRFAESSGNTDNPHQAVAACIEQAVSFEPRVASSRVGTTLAQQNEFDDATSTCSRLDNLQAAVTRVERAIASIRNFPFHESKTSPANAADPGANPSEFKTLSAWLNSMHGPQLANAELTLLQSRCAGIEFDHEGKDFFILRLDVETIGATAYEGEKLSRVQLLKSPRESPLAKTILANPASIFVMACQRGPVKDQWLISFSPKGGDGQLGEVLASISM